MNLCVFFPKSLNTGCLNFISCFFYFKGGHCYGECISGNIEHFGKQLNSTCYGNTITLHRWDNVQVIIQTNINITTKNLNGERRHTAYGTKCYRHVVVVYSKVVAPGSCNNPSYGCKYVSWRSYQPFPMGLYRSILHTMNGGDSVSNSVLMTLVYAEMCW